MFYSIGEFSRVTGLTVKALRFYHEEGVLTPAWVDVGTGYRYYTGGQVELGRAIVVLRDLELPVKEIGEILARRGDGERVAEVLERQKAMLEERIRKQKRAVEALRTFIELERQVTVMDTTTGITVKEVPPMVVAGIRTKGKYSECGKLFGKICRAVRGGAGGPPMMLYYDMEYKEEGADFEACVPLKKKKEVAGAEVRELPGGKAVVITHKGPYEELRNSYEKIFRYVKEKGYRIGCPLREVYIKGPGMIFRGNPKNYITEIQFMMEE
jgi:effector-binding domain-containing protein